MKCVFCNKETKHSWRVETNVELTAELLGQGLHVNYPMCKKCKREMLKKNPEMRDIAKLYYK